jgi:hypothetical protein
MNPDYRNRMAVDATRSQIAMVQLLQSLLLRLDALEAMSKKEPEQAR